MFKPLKGGEVIHEDRNLQNFGTIFSLDPAGSLEDLEDLQELHMGTDGLIYQSMSSWIDHFSTFFNELISDLYSIVHHALTNYQFLMC